MDAYKHKSINLTLPNTITVLSLNWQIKIHYQKYFLHMHFRSINDMKQAVYPLVIWSETEYYKVIHKAELNMVARITQYVQQLCR